MSDIALRTVGLGKMYRIGGEREQYRTLRDTLVQAAKRPIERIRHPGAATHTSEELWALKDIDLEVKHGEALGHHRPQRGGQEHAAQGALAHHRADRGQSRDQRAGWRACLRWAPASTASSPAGRTSSSTAPSSA